MSRSPPDPACRCCQPKDSLKVPRPFICTFLEWAGEPLPPDRATYRFSDGSTQTMRWRDAYALFYPRYADIAAAHWLATVNRVPAPSPLLEDQDTP